MMRLSPEQMERFRQSMGPRGPATPPHMQNFYNVLDRTFADMPQGYGPNAGQPQDKGPMLESQGSFSGPAMFPGMTKPQALQGMFGMQDGPGMFGPGGAPPRINRMYGGGRKPWRGGFGEQQPRQWNFPDMRKPRWGGQSPIPQEPGTPGEMDMAQLTRHLGLQEGQMNEGDVVNVNEIMGQGGDPVNYIRNAAGGQGIGNYAGIPEAPAKPEMPSRWHGVGMQRNKPVPMPPVGNRQLAMNMRNFRKRWR